MILNPNLQIVSRYLLTFDGFLGLDSWNWIPGIGFLGLESWVWIPGLGVLRMDSWAWIPRLGVLGLESWARIPGPNLTDIGLA